VPSDYPAGSCAVIGGLQSQRSASLSETSTGGHANFHPTICRLPASSTRTQRNSNPTSARNGIAMKTRTRLKRIGKDSLCVQGITGEKELSTNQESLQKGSKWVLFDCRKPWGQAGHSRWILTDLVSPPLAGASGCLIQLFRRYPGLPEGRPVSRSKRAQP
jgi:hypothetical protein